MSRKRVKQSPGMAQEWNTIQIFIRCLCDGCSTTLLAVVLVIPVMAAGTIFNLLYADSLLAQTRSKMAQKKDAEVDFRTHGDGFCPYIVIVYDDIHNIYIYCICLYFLMSKLIMN